MASGHFKIRHRYKLISRLLLAAALLMGGCSMEDEFLYFPSPEKPSDRELATRRLVLWQPTETDYRGLFTASPKPAPKGTIVLFHGNGGMAIDREFYMAPLTDLGFRVILAEYPKYGGRPGDVGEASFVADGLETVQLAYEQYKAPIYLLGESLGCGVVGAIAKKTATPVAGLILITPWDSLAGAARSLFPFLPAGAVLKDKYDTVANLEYFSQNIAIVAAQHDEVLPIDLAKNLYDTLPKDRKKMWEIKNAGHNDWPFYADRNLFKEVTDFVTGE